MKYAVTSLDIHKNLTQSSFNSISGNSITIPDSAPSTINFTIECFDIPNNLNTIEDFEAYLRGSNYDWATDEMITEALKEKYPERFL